jgi:hypothetical protein
MCVCYAVCAVVMPLSVQGMHSMMPMMYPYAGYMQPQPGMPAQQQVLQCFLAICSLLTYY